MGPNYDAMFKAPATVYKGDGKLDAKESKCCLCLEGIGDCLWEVSLHWAFDLTEWGSSVIDFRPGPRLR